jgi:2-amino-4-hydroxy-6-hydroxymethyldihydropteridine diphosphokinase
MRARVFIGVGSNIRPEANIAKAFGLLRLRAKIVAVSTMFWTKPLGDKNMDFFLNGVWELDSDEKPDAIREMLGQIEKECGRVRGKDKFGPRSIDLDLLLYNGMLESGDEGTRVHPDIRERAFVALPLLELAPEIRLPDTGEPLSSVTRGMTSQGLVRHDQFTERLRKEMLDG